MAHEGVLPCKSVVADGLYGQSPDLLDAVDACVGVTSCVAMPADTRGWLQRPSPADQTSRYQGEERSKRVLVIPDNAARPVAAMAASLPASRWYRRTVSEGTTGPMVYALARTRVPLCQEDLPERTVWLVITRTVGAEPTYSSSISHAPVSAPWHTFVWFSGLRWAIEQGCEEAKTARGMAQYEVRNYPGWHHQRLTTMLAPCFLWHLQLRVGKQSPSPYRVAATHDLSGCLTPTEIDE